MRQMPSLSLFAFYLVAEIKRDDASAASAYGCAFETVWSELARAYCETWASQSLKQKIQPLQELLHTEQYDLTNEVWVLCWFVCQPDHIA